MFHHINVTLYKVVSHYTVHDTNTSSITKCSWPGQQFRNREQQSTERRPDSCRTDTTELRWRCCSKASSKETWWESWRVRWRDCQELAAVKGTLQAWRPDSKIGSRRQEVTGREMIVGDHNQAMKPASLEAIVDQHRAHLKPENVASSIGNILAKS